MRFSLVLTALALPLAAVTHTHSTPYDNTFIDSVPLSADPSLAAATVILDHFMQAGINQDSETGAQLLLEYQRNEPHAVFSAFQIYKKHDDLFDGYRSISKDIYGYEIKKTLFGKSLEMEGGVETIDGFSHEFAAVFHYKNKAWRIHQISFERNR